jgi:thiol-disulfide isomerase/thioredoxin
LGVAAVLSGCGPFSASQTNNGRTHTLPAREIEGNDTDGKPMKLSVYRGKVVMVDFWAIWWGYCMAMPPHERSRVSRYKNQYFVLLEVSADDSPEPVQKVQQCGEVPWRSWWLKGKAADRVNSDWDISAYLTIILVDVYGKIQYKQVGRPDDWELERAINELVAEA